MTEEQAKKKTCPKMIWSFKKHPTGDYSLEYYYCIASDCMMWKYKDYKYIDPQSVPNDKKGNLQGYCGLTPTT